MMTFSANGRILSNPIIESTETHGKDTATIRIYFVEEKGYCASIEANVGRRVFIVPATAKSDFFPDKPAAAISAKKQFKEWCEKNALKKKSSQFDLMPYHQGELFPELAAESLKENSENRAIDVESIVDEIIKEEFGE